MRGLLIAAALLTIDLFSRKGAKGAKPQRLYTLKIPSEMRAFLFPAATNHLVRYGRVFRSIGTRSAAIFI
jgi:hypothetical protein